MTLSPEQRAAVAKWIAAGDSLAAVQQKLFAEFKISLTYMEVRFLVDDLGLELKSPAPAKPATPPSDLGSTKKTGAASPESPAKKGLMGKLKDAVGGRRSEPSPVPGAGEGEIADEDDLGDLADEFEAPRGTARVQVEVDRVTRPGTVASGTVTFSDGVTGKWALDQLGRLMIDAGKGYKPAPADVQAFQAELSVQLQRMGY